MYSLYFTTLAPYYLHMTSKPRTPYKRNLAPQGVASVLATALRRAGVDKQLNRYQFVLHWKEIVGEDIARFARPDCIQDGALVIKVMNSAWAQELSFHRETILSRLKKYTNPSSQIRDLIFQVDNGR